MVDERQKLDLNDLGTMDYRQTLELQLELVAKRQAGEIADRILLVEHNAVITRGANKNENKMILTDEQLAADGIAVEAVRRGGGTTAHNPGQIVVYPIVNIQSLSLGVSEYVRTLEDIGIELLAELGVMAGRKKGAPGLWIDGRKIGSIGVKIKRWVTYHGMAINIYNDLGIFDAIVPCGIEGVEMTSVLKETNIKWEMAEIKKRLSNICTKHFKGNTNEE